ncbi:MAG: glycerol-3-phosphate dehydrogenase [Spirulinaceae cyanobacterium SM2_1_0]|nr:glycerol-3-phosphate dehydrogenase [Spirulinaceae cyanobacterium SM2_1_0]
MRDFSAIQNETYDLIVIGGGVNGAAAARDAAMRGLKTILIEKNDFASGSSSWSTRLVHGGLRYLEYFEFPLVRESLRERELLLRNAPHLVKPLMLTVPVYGERSRPYWKIWAGMILYDIFSYDKTVPLHRMLQKQAFEQLFRALDTDQLKGGAQYYDAQAEYAERLCLENIFDARAHGATVLNYVEVTSLGREGERLSQLECRDRLTDTPFTLNSLDQTVIVNTAGPWVDRVLAQGQPQAISKTRKIGGTKGSHILVDRFAGMPDTALYVEAKTDGRPFFILPFLGKVLIGTTDLPFTGDLDCLKADNAEIDYLLTETNHIITTANLTRADVKFTYSGVRPLPYAEGKKPSELTRSHILYDHQSEGVQNLVSLIGGKLTTYRHVGEELVDWAFKRLNRTAPPCPTLKTALPGCILPTDARIKAAVNHYRHWVSAETVLHLFTLYGAQAGEVLALLESDPDLAAPIVPALPDIRAQIVYAVRAELAHTFLDITRRRTTIAIQADYGFPALPALRETLQRYCGWDDERCDRNTAEYTAYMHRNCVPDYARVETSAAVVQPV